MNFPCDILTQNLTDQSLEMYYLPQEYEYAAWEGYNMNPDAYLMDLLSAYCLCDTQLGLTDFLTRSCLSKQSSQQEPKMTKGKIFDDATMQVRVTNLVNMIEEITDCYNPVIRATKKVQRRNLSSRRSSYIGVSRNGPNWQAMISINKRKSYIGTYSSEEEAALAFDYHSLLIHGLSAKTNFSYTKPQLMELITKFNM